MREILEIEDMNCINCFNTIKRFLLDCDGVNGIDANLDNKTLIIDYNQPTTYQIIKEAIEDSGFSIKQRLNIVE